jgi:hypothetical protein
VVGATAIISPTQGWKEVMDHVDRYLAFGVKSCWVVTPFNRTVMVITANGEETFTKGVVTDPIIGLKADLTEVFP